ncbi:MAG: plasmid pRiA4b ORF-3 family protein [Lachnospiraceae bacterium]|nr:plasmid pRiA4b ORF-3 family protein [Lachnospiraceae bacterium]MDE6621878.1 plasmid pRiA4b ORF-3 family protein [Lachnospiraceae bacterium]
MENQYTLKVYPAGMGTSVYRVIEISGKDTLQKLCSTILSAFDFIDEHLYEFCMDNRMYSDYSYQSDPEAGQPTVKVKLDKLGLVKGQKFSLHYDFGDDWMFTINVQKITETAESVKPRVVKEKGHVEQYPDWDDDDYEDYDE